MITLSLDTICYAIVAVATAPSAVSVIKHVINKLKR